ncbi:MAG: Isopentenyl phosphate kinase [Candidatus Alkanophagales archaeon MCA70_species_1]|nr:Isopentenyl phosphate kinase [Candidatus Alkanophaga volatiphilum]
MGGLCVLKIGGGVITEKSEEEMPKLDQMRRISREIKESDVRKLVLIHGAGSFGHPQAARYFKSRDVKDALKTHAAVKRLNCMFVEALSEVGLDVIPVHPMSCAVMRGSVLKMMNLESVRLALSKGIIPVLHGDIVLDELHNFSILSGDDILVHVAAALNASRAGAGVREDGVFAKRDSEIYMLREITPSNFEALRPEVEEFERHLASASEAATAKTHDVTGRMISKVEKLLKLAATRGISSLIFNAEKEYNVLKFLRGEVVSGTVVRP